MEASMEDGRSGFQRPLTGNSSSGGQSLTSSEILNYLPHRYPFLLIDRVDSYAADKYIKATKLVSTLDPYMQGHFPGNPVMPGVLLVEAMAQASAILGKISKGDACNTCLLTEVSESRFKRQVVPGDVLSLDVQLLRHRQGFFWFQGEATVSGEMAAVAKFTAKLA